MQSFQTAPVLAEGGTPPGKREFAWHEGLALCLAMIGVQLGSEVINTWGTFFYSPTESVGRTVYVSVGLVGFIFIIGTVWDALTDPLIGAWSDRTAAEPGPRRFPKIRGRRRPYIFWGAMALLVTTTIFWFPPVEGTHIANFIFGSLILCLHWTAFTLGYVPVMALSQEIARSEKARIRMGIWIGVGMLLGLALAAFAGELIAQLDPARESGSYSAMGYRRAAAIIAVACAVLFLMPVWLVRERFHDQPMSSEHASLLHGMKGAFQNRPFIIFFSAFLLFGTGFLATQKALPYWAEIALQGDEGTVTSLFIPFLICALLTYAVLPFVAKWFSAKWLTVLAFFILATGMPFMYVIGVMDASPETKFLMGATLFGYAGIAQGIMFVMLIPMLGQVIDHDEVLSGHRREALYNGLNGVAWKAAAAGAILTSTQCMHWFGNSPANPLGVYLVGPVAGLLAVFGLLLMLLYPEPKSN